MMSAICGNGLEYGAKLKRAIIFCIMVCLAYAVVVFVVVKLEYKSVGRVGQCFTVHLGSTHNTLDVLLQFCIRLIQFYLLYETTREEAPISQVVHSVIMRRDIVSNHAERMKLQTLALVSHSHLFRHDAVACRTW